MNQLLRYVRATAPAASPDGAADRDLLLARFAREGDGAAFAALVRRHGGAVWAACRRLLDRHEDAEDAFQAVFLTLAREAGSVGGDLPSWLHEVARRVAANLRRAARRRAAREDAARVPEGRDVDLTSREGLAVLDAELARLPRRYRAVLIACCLEGRSRDEAARQLGRTPGRVKGLLERGRELLRRRLARRGFDLGATLLAATVAHSAVAVPVVPVEAGVGPAQGRAATGVSPVAGALSERVVRAMLIQKVKPVALVLLATALAGGVLARRAAEGTEPGPPRAAVTGPPPPAAPPDLVLVRAPLSRDPVRPEWVKKQTFSHKAAVHTVAFDRGRVAAGDQAGRLLLWDVKTGAKAVLVETGALVGAGGKSVPVSFAQFGPDGKAIYFSLADGTTIQQCTLVKGGENLIFPGAVQPDGPKARTPGVDSVIPGAFPGDIQIGGVSPRGLTPDGKYWLESIALFDPDYYQLSIVPNRLPEFDEQLVGVPVATFRHPGLVAHAAPVSAEAAVSVSSTGRLRRWQKGKDEPVWEVNLRDLSEGKTGVPIGPDGKRAADVGLTAVLVAPDGKRVAVTGDGGEVWTFDTVTGKLLAQNGSLTRTRAVCAAAFSPDGGRIVVGGEDRMARVYDARTGQELAVLEGHADRVTAVAFGPDGTIVTGSADKTVKVWECRK